MSEEEFRVRAEDRGRADKQATANSGATERPGLGTMTTTTSAPEYGTPGVASANVQWHGTNVCVDIICKCGAGGHFDGYAFSYALRCRACGQVYLLPHNIPLIESTLDALGGRSVHDLDHDA